MIPNRLAALRAEMAARGITCYIIPTADFHESEYVGEYFKARVYMTGFTGSAGTLVVTPDHAGLWTDARYFLQAERQLEGSTVTLYKMGEEGVPTLNEFLKNTLTAGGKLGFDGRVVSSTFGKTLKELCAAVGFCLLCERLLASLAMRTGARDLPSLLPLARILSEELEYSEENTEALKLLFLPAEDC